MAVLVRINTVATSVFAHRYLLANIVRAVSDFYNILLNKRPPILSENRFFCYN